ncbi:MAG: hypothetical protein QMD85_02710, partial [Candidatus Aenigmarchaeota archaeon]|nr:hypothetical protein [Candidatus Aenigmarchaeota archaeon]
MNSVKLHALARIMAIILAVSSISLAGSLAPQQSPPENRNLGADNTPPTVSVTGAPGQWQNTDATAGVSCSDASGCDETSYALKIYDAEPARCSNRYDEYDTSAPSTIFDHSWVCAAAKDTVGNEGFSGVTEFRVDEVVPESSALCNGDLCAEDPEYYTEDVVLTFDSIDDGGSGLREVRYSVDGAPDEIYNPESPHVFSDHGHYFVEYWATDNAGNAEERRILALFINKNILVQDLVVDLKFMKLECEDGECEEEEIKNIKIRKLDEDVNFFAYVSCYTIDQDTGDRLEDCAEGATEITSFEIDTKSGKRDYLTEAGWVQEDNWDEERGAWRFPIDTIIYRSNAKVCANHNDVPGCDQDQYLTFDGDVTIDVTYPDLQNFIVPATDTGAPNFTRSMPIWFNSVVNIAPAATPAYKCQKNDCLVFYRINDGEESGAKWDDFAKAYSARPASNGLECD